MWILQTIIKADSFSLRDIPFWTSDVMVDILTLIRMDIKSASSVLISHDAAKMLWEKAYERGHSNGFNEVYYAIEDYEEVVIEALKGKR